jgi:hypothetical protein
MHGRSINRRSLSSRIWALFAGGFTALMIGAIPTASASGNVNLFFGVKGLDAEEWTPIDNQDELGVQVTVDVGKIGIAVDLLRSNDKKPLFDSVNIEGTTTELCVGVRKIWGKKLRPFFGGGLAFIEAEIQLSDEFDSVEDDHSTVGFWLDGGVFYQFAKHFNIGIDARLSATSTEEEYWFGQPVEPKTELGGFHLGVLVGVGW